MEMGINSVYLLWTVFLATVTRLLQACCIAVYDALVKVGSCLWALICRLIPFKNKNKGDESVRFWRKSSSEDPEQGLSTEDEDESLASDDEYELPFSRANNKNYPIGARVRALDSNHLYYGGSVVWTGYRKTAFYKKLVVVRLDGHGNLNSTNGKFERQRLAPSRPDAQYVMLPVVAVYNIEHLDIGDYCIAVKGPKYIPFSRGFVRGIKNYRVTIYPANTEYSSVTRQSQKSLEYPDYVLQKVPPPVTEEKSDYVLPISPDNLPLFFGRNKGIQGKNNSCYLDTLLFSLFAFSDAVLDDLTTKEATGGMSEEFNVILSTLRYQIVFPLRASHFVSDSHVEFLRRYMGEKLNDERFETETRDIPECLEALFEKFLSWRPSLEIGELGPGEPHFNSTFMAEIIDTSVTVVPTTQLLLEASTVNFGFCIRSIPNFFFLQLPRQVDLATSVVIPSLELDLKNILHDTVKVCADCGRNARLQFPELFEVSSLSSTFMCRTCAERRGLNIQTGRPLPEPKIPDGGEPEARMLLSAVICIERSHYNCFVRCGSGGPEDRWVFFDSMSDREELFDPDTNKKEQFNIPLVKEVPNFREWIQGGEEEYKKDRMRSFLAALPAGEWERADRLFKFPYMCLYTPAT